MLVALCLAVAVVACYSPSIIDFTLASTPSNKVSFASRTPLAPRSGRICWRNTRASVSSLIGMGSLGGSFASHLLSIKMGRALPERP